VGRVGVEYDAALFQRPGVLLQLQAFGPNTLSVGLCLSVGQFICIDSMLYSVYGVSKLSWIASLEFMLFFTFFLCQQTFAFSAIVFSALTMLVGQQAGHPACKKTEWLGCWHGCLPLPLTVSCFSKILIGFTFLVQVVLDKGPLNAHMYVCSCLQNFSLLKV